ncbi:MAG TPA: type II toxin-antitoxin system MqsR family toxin [Longimicrobiales bacterium]|nr:type II toxin-antitoxin system MqsR family toxin [Longimicrobiales bacterium]
MAAPHAPTYPLSQVQGAVRRGSYWVTRSAGHGAMALDLDESDIRECVARLGPSDFYKTMPSERVPGLFQDVYLTRHHGLPIYLKVQLAPNGDAVVVSFKRDESA